MDDEFWFADDIVDLKVMRRQELVEKVVSLDLDSLALWLELWYYEQN